MKILLDTNAFIWWDATPAQLSPSALTAITDPATSKLLSVASIWEMQIKLQIGKITLKQPLAQLIAQQQQTHGFQILPVNLDHVPATGGLPMGHKDPLDRLLAAQAIAEGASLIAADPIFGQYPVTVIW